jgi:hypothetical protein
LLLYGIEKGRFQERNRPLTWVELRGFEPLTPSMRTERTLMQSCCHGTFLHVREVEPGTVTVPDRG